MSLFQPRGFLPGALVFLGGCVAALDQPKARDARRDLPTHYVAVQGAADEVGPPAPAAAQQRYDVFFADPRLRSLIQQALETNQEFNLRVQEIILARNEAGAQRGEIFPRVDVGTGAGLERVSQHTSQGVGDEAHGLSSVLPDFHYGLSASWEVDLWGKLRKAAEAADHRYLASVEARDFMVTEIVAEVASSYFDLVGLDLQVGMLEENVGVLESALSMVKHQKAAGRATELAVRRFQAEIQENRARALDLSRERVAAENRIRLVMGRHSVPLDRAPGFTEAALAPIQAGLPSELLRNRPDVREAEHRLAASKLDVDVARARFYPSLTIDANLGLRAFNPLHLLDFPNSLAAGVGAGVMMPLVNKAGITADYRNANARQVQAVLLFEKALLRAYLEVTTQLARADNLALKQDLVNERVKTLSGAVEVSHLLYQSARADYVEVLLTRRDALGARMELARTQQEHMQALVGLYQALGGGWQGRNAASAKRVP